MQGSKGYTLMEIVVVLTIIGVIAGFYFPSFTVPDEKAWAANAKNNLLAIYSAQQNYKNNNGSYATLSALSAIDSTLSLSIQDDGTYLYDCGVTTANACTAKRSTTPSTNIVVTLNSAINLSGSGTANPQCNTSNYYCP